MRDAFDVHLRHPEGEAEGRAFSNLSGLADGREATPLVHAMRQAFHGTALVGAQGFPSHRALCASCDAGMRTLCRLEARPSGLQVLRGMAVLCTLSPARARTAQAALPVA